MNEILQKRIEQAARKFACKRCVFNDGGTCNNDSEFCELSSTIVEAMTFTLQNQWISVEEALPPISKVYNDEKWSDWVLIRTHKGGTCLDSYIFHKHTWTNNDDDVTHWMPIPSLEGGE